jgi:hypothetical protein
LDGKKRWKQLERKEGQTRTWVLDNKVMEMQHVMHEQMYELFFRKIQMYELTCICSTGGL